MNSFKYYLEELLFSGKRIREIQFLGDDDDEVSKTTATMSIFKIDSESELFALEKKHKVLRGVALANGDLYVISAMNNFHIDIVQYLQNPRISILRIPEHRKIKTWELYNKFIKYFITLQNCEYPSNNHIWGIGESQPKTNHNIIIELNKKFPAHLFLPKLIDNINPLSSVDEYKTIIQKLPKIYSPLQLENRIRIKKSKTK